jgi:dephospho-CoA kinase
MPTKPRRPPAKDGLWIIGLVGLPGSGKSTVAVALANDGAHVLDADAIGHAITDRDPEVRTALMAEYGASVYGSAGLDRARVAERVFRDPEARERLNRLVHPRIQHALEDALEAERRAGFEGVVVVDAALLLDWGFERSCDAVVAVVAPLEARLERLERERGWTREQGLRRMEAQRPESVLIEAADVTLDNTGRPDALGSRALDAIRRLRAAAQEPKGTNS